MKALPGIVVSFILLLGADRVRQSAPPVIQLKRNHCVYQPGQSLRQPGFTSSRYFLWKFMPK
jgi:hypothetical protein